MSYITLKTKQGYLFLKYIYYFKGEGGIKCILGKILALECKATKQLHLSFLLTMYIEYLLGHLNQLIYILGKKNF